MLSCPFANFADINTALYAEVPPAKYVLLIAMITLDTLVYPLFTVGQEGKLFCLRPFWNPQNHMITCVATVFDRRSALYSSSARLRHTTFAHIVVWAFHAFVSNARNILLSARIALYTLVNFAVHFLFYVRSPIEATRRKASYDLRSTRFSEPYNLLTKCYC
jgi:hypothetical protein